jgi:putative tryptophan/tyrosine transport system substrate-binding protein
MKRREFIAGLGGAVALPLTGHAQQTERMRHVGVLMTLDENDPEPKVRLSAFTQALADLGWNDGRNVRMDLRWAGSDTNRMQALAQELVRLQPDIIVATSTPATVAVQRETRTIPIVFGNVSDPVVMGIVAALNQPGGNFTGFAFLEASLGGKWLELLSEIAPWLKRAAIMFNPDTALASAFMPSFETAARSLKVVPITAPVHDDIEIETAIVDLGREPGGGLVVMSDIFTAAHGRPIISAAARNNNYRRSIRSLAGQEKAVCSPTDPTGQTSLACWCRRLPPMWIAFCAARSRAISRCSFRRNTRWSSTSRPPRHSALPFRRTCSRSPTR